MSAFDLITLGRSSLDLFAEQIGAPFVAIESFATQVGGSPTNVAQGVARLGLRTAAATAVGDDKVGEFIRVNLARGGVGTQFVWTKTGRSPLAVVGVQPPSTFPLVFYREAAPDWHIDQQDVATLPWGEMRALLVAGSNFARPRLRDASTAALRHARNHNVTSYFDLDLRFDQWPSLDDFATVISLVTPLADVLIGTEEEFDAAQVDPFMPQHAAQIIVLKRGADGVTLVQAGVAPIDIPPYRVTVVNTVGAGDSFASGFIAQRLNGDSLEAATRYANACGAITVTRHGCATAFPTPAEVDAFLSQQAAIGGV